MNCAVQGKVKGIPVGHAQMPLLKKNAESGMIPTRLIRTVHTGKTRITINPAEEEISIAIDAF
jgi:hypothetical protein